ncbi:MAG TPA: BlaI/MecI/CopY family transcriptional regulator [Candidatus Fusicatenibacter intestinigallinarum]|uniref:BlaI/MecI/CopY family transcriptional regulator n=1 Tax=Candidatus Fusicatenibacter intestinigallinarum TaxID=2838598 RepID=A0A9D2NDB3_9FIRM|nr:BlaI/MecI/CopY family transcriptional regulator [Candidatus Fusicatenibacter intestinigallinarum]
MRRKIQKLPDSELDVMIALWNGHGEMTRSEIEDFMKRKKKLAPTTILTLLSRLEKKKFVSVKKEGKANLYRALVTQEQYQQQEGKHVLEKLYGNSLKNFVATLYQGKQIDQSDIEELEAFLQELEKDQ